MVKRRKRKTRKTVRKSATKAKGTARKAASYNRKALWKAYRELQIRADKAWHKFRNDVKKNARSEVIINDHNQLLLLLGECNYMARECMRMAAKGKKQARR